MIDCSADLVVAEKESMVVLHQKLSKSGAVGSVLFVLSHSRYSFADFCLRLCLDALCFCRVSLPFWGAAGCSVLKESMA